MGLSRPPQPTPPDVVDRRKDIVEEIATIRACFDQQERRINNLEHVLAMLVIKMRKGVTTTQLLEWWDAEGKRLAKKDEA